MARINEEELKKKIKDGYIHAVLMIEAMAITKEHVISALEKHVEKMERDAKCLVFKKEFGKAERVEAPFKNIKEAYSSIAEVEILTKKFDDLIYVVLNYGPSSVEIIEPGEIRIDISEMQGIVNGLAALVHKFAALHGGGIIVST